MFDVLLCYGFATNVIRAGYLGLVGDLFREAWANCRRLGAAAKSMVRGPLCCRTAYLRRANGFIVRRLLRLETHVTSTR